MQSTLGYSAVQCQGWPWVVLAKTLHCWWQGIFHNMPATTFTEVRKAANSIATLKTKVTVGNCWQSVLGVAVISVWTSIRQIVLIFSHKPVACTCKGNWPCCEITKMPSLQSRVSARGGRHLWRHAYSDCSVLTGFVRILKILPPTDHKITDSKAKYSPHVTYWMALLE